MWHRVHKERMCFFVKRKYLAVLIAVLGALLMVSGAQADDYPTNPRRGEVERIRRLYHSGSHLLEGSSSNNEFELKMVSAPGFSSGGEFEIVKNVEGDFSYSIYLEDRNLESDLNMLYNEDFTETTFSLPQITYPSSYRVFIFARNIADETESYFMDEYFTVAADGTHPTLDQVVSNVVNSNRVAGDDWQTALNLHDYLTHNAYYDNTLTIYGADGVLLRGTGVCDSYSKAYTLLLRKAGISVHRVISGQMNHAWNRVCIDGIWGHVDVTWDDPSGSTEVVSGSEYHHFFLVSDDFFQDGSYHRRHYGYTTSPACTSMKSSAIYLLSEEWTMAEYYKDESYETGSYTDLIQAQIDQHVSSFDISIYPRLASDGNRYYDITNEQFYTYYNRKFSLYALIKSLDAWKDPEGNILTVNITFIANSATDRKFHVETDAVSPDLADAVITLPADVVYVYTGEMIAPVPVVMMGELELVAEDDYSVAYENNLHAGTASLTVTGNNIYTGAQTVEYIIQPFDLSNAETVADGVSAFVYSGREKKPQVYFELEDAILLDEESYELTYQNNVQPGTGTVQAVGTGTDVIGACEWNFSILRSGTAVCVLPEDLTLLEAEAFALTDFREIILPNNPVTVEAYCFTEMQSQAVQITVPNAASQIDATAFNGVENATVIAPAALTIGNESISDFCLNNGMYYENIAD